MHVLQQGRDGEHKLTKKIIKKLTGGQSAAHSGFHIV